jgi:uncharacterized protein GlcG (DUF336 family)
MAAAEAEATKNNWGVAIAIIDSGGNFGDVTTARQRAAIRGPRIAEAMARTAVEFRREGRNVDRPFMNQKISFFRRR